MRYRYQSGDTVHEVELQRHGNAWRATVYGEVYEVDILDEQPGAFVLHTAGPFAADDLIRPQTVYWAADGASRWLSSGGCTYRLDRPREGRRTRVASQSAADTIHAPMPALVRAIEIAEGDAVAAGQTLLLLEAMKMEIKLTAPRAGRITRVLTQPGATVERDQVLMELA